MTEAIETPAVENPAAQEPETQPAAAPETEQPGTQKAPETQTEGADDKQQTQEPSLHGAPETYTDFTMEEGIAADPELMQQFGKLAKDLNLSQAGAQKLINMQNGITKKMAAGYGAAFEAHQKAQTDARLAAEYQELQTDSEIGGAKLNETLGLAGYAFDALGCGDARDVILSSNLGNNRAIINMLAKVGRVLKEDGFAAGESGNVTRSDAELLYPDWKK